MDDTYDVLISVSIDINIVLIQKIFLVQDSNINYMQEVFKTKNAKNKKPNLALISSIRVYQRSYMYLIDAPVFDTKE